LPAGLYASPQAPQRSCRTVPNAEEPPFEAALRAIKAGGDLLSQAVAHQVPSARRGLTALFGMGRGVSPSLWPPKSLGTAAVPAGLENCTQAKKVKPSSPRPISTGLLSALPRLHSRPINLVIYQGPYALKGMGELISR
jgi:hypothetical protein